MRHGLGGVVVGGGLTGVRHGIGGAVGPVAGDEGTTGFKQGMGCGEVNGGRGD